ncbi:MAG: SIMPL domain-containing protein [bacterium]
MSDRNSHFSWGLLAIGVSIVLSAFILSGAAVSIKRARDTITVTGSARMRVTCDYVVWRGNIVVNAATVGVASQALHGYRAKVQKFFREKGLADTAAVFKTVYSTAQQEYKDGGYTGRIFGYEVSQAFEVHSNDLDRILAVADAMEALMREGVPLQLSAPEFYYTPLDEARVKLMAEATMDAHRRAEQIAAAAGGEIGPIREARMGVIQVVAPYSMAVSDYGMYDTSTREKDIVATVKTVFALK